MPKSKKQYAYGIVKKENGEIIKLHLTRLAARVYIKDTVGYKIVVFELRKVNKKP